MSPETESQQPKKLPLVSGEHPSFRRHSGRMDRWFRRVGRWFLSFSRVHPVIAIFTVIILLNVLHTIFNIGYNTYLIKEHLMNKDQQNVFTFVVIPFYNGFIYPACLGAMYWFLQPLRRVHSRLLRGEKLTAEETSAVHIMLVDYPYYYVCINFAGWLGGAICFPLLVCWLGGSHNAPWIWLQFMGSFIVGGLITVMQVFFVLESILVRALYPLYFKKERPAQVKGVVPQLSFRLRFFMLFLAVGMMPLVALFLLALNFAQGNTTYITFAWIVFIIGSISAGIIFFSMGMGLFRWLMAHQTGTDEIAAGNLKYRIHEKRPDEWGKLTDQFNDMAEALEDAEHMRETFGQIKHPAVRDAIIDRYTGIEGEVCEITVLFSDIRGFTRRSAGQPPEKVFALLNRFLTLAVRAVEDNDGLVDKFLGDGIMALFGTPVLPRSNHADLALKAGSEMLERLQILNDELIHQGEDPLTIGIGIHTGPALTGCPGATLQMSNGKTTMRRDYTAIGETVNLSQRMEEFTKTLGGPILISGRTQQRLRSETPLEYLGEHDVRGYGGSLEVYKVLRNE